MTLDCLVIGGGPTGLVAALYLARFRRSVVVVDAGQSRAALIPLSHNIPGFPQGIKGQDFLNNLRNQLRPYHVDIIKDTVLELSKDPREGKKGGDGAGVFSIKGEGNSWKAKTVILATGIKETWPEFPNVEKAIQEGHFRHCPICDGYEVIDKKIGIIGQGEKVLQEALFLKNYTSDITLITLGVETNWGREQQRLFQQNGFRLLSDPLMEVVFHPGMSSELRTKTGERHIFQSIYLALGMECQSQLGRGSGCQVNDKGQFQVDDRQRTSIPGLFAIGDVVEGPMQISVGVGQAAMAAITIHQDLMNNT